MIYRKLPKTASPPVTCDQDQSSLRILKIMIEVFSSDFPCTLSDSTIPSLSLSRLPEPIFALQKLLQLWSQRLVGRRPPVRLLDRRLLRRDVSRAVGHHVKPL